MMHELKIYSFGTPFLWYVWLYEWCDIQITSYIYMYNRKLKKDMFWFKVIKIIKKNVQICC